MKNIQISDVEYEMVSETIRKKDKKSIEAYVSSLIKSNYKGINKSVPKY